MLGSMLSNASSYLITSQAISKIILRVSHALLNYLLATSFFCIATILILYL